jgi:uncharacterized membrane protein
MAEQETRSSDEAPEAERQGEDGARHGGNGAGETVAQELKRAIQEAALEVLGPAARQATSSAAKYAVSKGPDLVTKHVVPAVRNAGGSNGLGQWARSTGAEALSGSGGIAGIAGKLMSKLGGKGGGGAASGWGHNRRMPVQQVIYVSVPVKDAYNGWTEYKQWPRFMHRANQVDAQVNDQDARVKVTEKMWGFKRPFAAEIVTQRPDEHIKWNSTEGTKHTGVINFHELGPRLTLIEVNLDHSPSGPVEKLARGARFVKRAVRADFHRFRGWIEMKSDDELAELEGWRGTIEGGEIVTSHEDALEAEQREEEGEPQDLVEGEYEEAPEAAEQEEPEAAEQEEPEAAEQGEPEAGEEEEPEAAEREEPEAAEREEPEADEREEPEAAAQEEPEAREEEEPEAAEREEPEAGEEEEPEAAEQEEPEAYGEAEESHPPRPRQPRARTRQQASRAGERPRSAATRRQPRSA